MINLLPQTLKEEVAYSRKNTTVMRYLKLGIMVSVMLVAILYGARYYLNQQIAQTQNSIANKQLQIGHYKSLQHDAKLVNARLVSIQKVQTGQAKFSLLLSDLAQYMPKGTAITSLTLTGDDKKPVRLTVEAQDYKTALGFRDSIARSQRISAADIETIEATTDAAGKTTYKVTITFTFSPGAAK